MRNDNNGTENRAFSDLHEAAAKGYWGKAEEIFKGNRKYVRRSLTDAGDTALHVAVVAGRNDFLTELVRSDYIKEEDLEMKNGDGNTALFVAAMLGNIEVVLSMLEKNQDLVNVRNEGRKVAAMLPVQMAASLGDEEMVNCLYKRSKDHLNDDDRIRLLLTLIENNIYDVALSMVKEFPRLAVFRAQKTDGNGEKIDGNVETALHALARKPLMKFKKFGISKGRILRRFCYRFGEEDNTILHLAAKLPPDQNRLKVVSGAALQMQRELWWFKEVRKLMPPSYAGAKNKKAAFTLPGGIKDDTGDPHFLRKASFICFAIFDIISLVSSSCSIVIFLSILTARYAEKDFLRSLPRKLLLGLFTLCISIVAMMAVFCTTLFITFDDGTKVPALLAIALASILVLIFILLQIRLFLNIFYSLMSYNISLCKAK
ncbi:hypothetical protein Q3G72_006075 [Acer saccharum]|nr:hypothetical protein Q3G72_006075 [Acer saccharum]